MWMMPLHLHVNQKSDYDDDDDIIIQFVSHTVWFFAKSIEKKIAKEWSIWHTNKYVAFKQKKPVCHVDHSLAICFSMLLTNFGPFARKIVFGVSDLASFKPVSSATETSY